MKLKRISAIVLALAMTASLAAFAAEDETPDVVVDEGVIREVNHDQGDISLLAAPAGGGFGGGLLTIPIALPKQNYATTITINGEPLESYEHEKPVAGSSWETEVVTVNLTDLPSVPAGYVPMRAVAQADGGYAQWFKESSTSRFYMGNSPIGIVVSLLDMSVTVDDQPVEETALLIGGVTYVPVSIFNGMEGFSVVDNSQGGVESYDIKTPNGAPLVVMAKQLKETADVGGMQTSMEELIMYYGEEFGFSEEVMAECIAFLPVSTNAYTLILARLTNESKQAEIKASFEAYQAYQRERCNWGYLMDSLPAIENAQTAFAGDWALFVIAENAEAAAAQLESLVAGLE